MGVFHVLNCTSGTKSRNASQWKKHLLKCLAKSQSRIQEKESASVRDPVNLSSIMFFITKEETVKDSLGV